MDLKKAVVSFLSLLICIFVFSLPIQAEEYRSDYKVEYFLEEDGERLDTRVKFTIDITNLQSDLYVKKFILTFPQSFTITNLKARDDRGEIHPAIEQKEDNYAITLEFTDPKVGKNSKNSFSLEFNQSNLFNVSGNVWEVILPTVEGRESGDYEVLVHLPEGGRRISIAKPKPTLIQGSTIIWKNPETRTIYAVFGEKQYYDLNLKYNLINSRITPVYTEIAFPPDTLYQKIYVDLIKPVPHSVYQDVDGNYIGKYYLRPKEKKVINFRGTAEISSTYRSEVKSQLSDQLETQKKYLLSTSKHWMLDRPEKYSALRTPGDIYHFLIQNLSYDYKRVDKNIQRLGANLALANPKRAVCTEYSDSFIAIAREKGIYAREIQGYGFSKDPHLRPLSLATDVLHSWQEYFDPQKGIWIPIDPTWEDTSGIDYFNSFDLNHIVFAIHGKSSEVPYPAGTYKISDTRDIFAQPSTKTPREKRDISLTELKTRTQIDTGTTYTGKLTLENKGNTFQYDEEVLILGENISVQDKNINIQVIAPHEKREIPFRYMAKRGVSAWSGKITVRLSRGNSIAKNISIVPFQYSIALWLAAIVALVFLTVIAVFKFRNKNANSIHQR